MGERKRNRRKNRVGKVLRKGEVNRSRLTKTRKGKNETG